MQNLANLIIAGLLLFSISSFGQKAKGFTIDTVKILTNENLDDFVRSLKTDSFQISVNKNAIPRHIKKQLNRLTDGFSIGNPDQAWQCCCTSSRQLPERQLNFLAKSKHVLVMTYKKGGIGVSNHLLLIRFDDNKIIDLWTGYCWTEVSKVSNIVSYIEKKRKNNQELNTNMITL